MPVFIRYDGVDAAARGDQEPYLRIKPEDTLVSSWQTSAAGAPGGQIHIESFSWGVSQTGAHASAAGRDGNDLLIGGGAGDQLGATCFDGTFLAARDLTRDQDGTTSGGTTLGDVVIVKQLDKAASGGAGDDILIAGTTGYDGTAIMKATFKEFTVTKKTGTSSLGDDGIDLLFGGAGDELDAARADLDDLNSVRNGFGAVGAAEMLPGLASDLVF